jgi:ferric-dicitrate binding protein FerR (iron transport regulator)
MDTVVAPGTTKAMLILADGTKIELTEAKIGEVANDGTVSIRKTANGQLIYDLSNLAEDNSGMIKYNTIETPRGGEYHVILPDGTLVWLNSASSLKFPTRFSGMTREVTLVGEAYFEVFHNNKQPFHVHVKDTKVGVLGTHFNVSAYEDDNGVTTTLLEGSVSVSKNKKEFVLKPGQQSVTADNTDRIIVKGADIEQVMAWRNGYFRFNDEEIGSILKKVSRWYDVDIENRTTRKGQRLGGISSRSKSLKDLMDQLEKVSDLHFKIEGRRIIVLD